MFLSEDLQRLIQVLGRLPGLGPRSARRIALHLVNHRRTVLPNTVQLLQTIAQTHQDCPICGYLDARAPCFFCTSDHRHCNKLCIVAQTGDVWALEKAAFFTGRYHVLGGLISAFSGKRPEDLNLKTLWPRLDQGGVEEVILAMDGTLEGQTTQHYVSQQIGAKFPGLALSTLARGLPMGGELEVTDQGTLMSAFAGRHQVAADSAVAALWLSAGNKASDEAERHAHGGTHLAESLQAAEVLSLTQEECHVV
jgi:recombination protein RecR